MHPCVAESAVLGESTGGPQGMKYEKLGFWGTARKGLGLPAVLAECQILQCAQRGQRNFNLCFASLTPYSWGWGMAAALPCALADGRRSSWEEGQCLGVLSDSWTSREQPGEHLLSVLPRCLTNSSVSSQWLFVHMSYMKN